MTRFPLSSILTFLCVLLACAGDLDAQTVAAERGVVGTGLRLRQLDGVKRVLLVGAHPDDEDTSLIAALARGWGADVAYLSLSRGEGGQNLIGPELDEGLGMVRTGELLAARELDGGWQLFARAFDFGYSKSAEETFRYWPRREIVADVVWMVRTFRPQVIVSIFPPGPDAGHGQHQAAGIAAHEAFEAAGDPERFPEQLDGPGAVEPWTPVKLYESARFDPEDATSRVETGHVDPLLGRSHFQLAMESRSRHRSQSMGAPEPLGPRSARLILVRSRGGDSGDEGIFAGVDTTLVSVADGLQGEAAERLRQELERYRTLVRESAARLEALRAWRAAPPLSRALAALERARKAVPAGPEGAEARRILDRKLEVAGEALLSAAGMVADARVDDDLVVPGEELEVELTLWNGGPFRIEGGRPEPSLPEGWSAVELGPPEGPEEGGLRARLYGTDRGTFVRGSVSVPPGGVARWRYRVRVGPDADLSRPYYLRQARDGAMYRWPDDRSLWGLPRNPPVLEGRFELSPAGSAGGGESLDPVELEVRRPAGFVGADEVRGEFRRPLLVVPPVSVSARPRIMAWPLDQDRERSVSAAVRAEAKGGFRGRLRLDVPEGWTAEPDSVELSLDEPDQERSVTFRVAPVPGASAGFHDLRAVVTGEEGGRFAEEAQIVDYPHIDRDLLFRDARTRVSMFPLRVDRSLRVGYVMGPGDAGADALRQMGLEVDLLGPDAVREGAFEPYDVVVLGVRAYETRPDLVASNAQLLDWVREGGTLIVQYNRYRFSEAGLAPHPVRIDRPHDRVTDPEATVTLLDPESPVFTGPNRITAEDFQGWAQERGLYFLGEWGDAYTPLLEMSDPGEEPKRGSLLVTPLGEGLWIYTGLAFFRQFPEGVPGAYRLFANLVSLRADDWRAHHGGESGTP